MQDAHEYVLIKRGLYYRPDAHGYTRSLAEAGIYNGVKADCHCQVPGVTKKRLIDLLKEIDAEREAINTRLAELDKFERRALGLHD
jgi:hypothetical protein